LFLAGVVLQAGLSLAANTAWPGLRDPLYFDKYAKLRRRVASRTTAAGRPVTVVMFGSSRTLLGLDGRLLEDELAARLGRPTVAFNFGMPAAGPITNLVNLRRLLEAGERPDLVLIEVMPPLLAAQQPVPQEYRFLLPERLLPAEVAVALTYGFPADDVRGRWWQSALVPWYGLRFPILGRLASGWLPWALRFDSSRNADAAGWFPVLATSVSPEEYRRAVARTREEYRPMLEGLCFGGPPSQALRDSLALCRDHGARAALVLMPEGSDFRGWYPPGARAALAELLDGLSQTFGAPLIDAREWLGDDGFTDGHHLLPSGAVAFTRRLGAELLSPLGPMTQSLNTGHP
jgi:hypothetical protein